MTALVVIEAAVLAVLAILVVGLLRSYGDVLRRLHALDGGQSALPAQPPSAGQALPVPGFPTSVGVVAPTTDAARADWPIGHDVVGTGLAGEVISVSILGARRDTVLLFLSSGCTGCASFWADLANPNPLPTAMSRLIIITKGVAEESPGLLRELCPAGVDLVMSSQAWSDYQVPGSPYVMVVNGATGRVQGEGSGTSLSQVSGLIRQSLGDVGGSGHSGFVVKPRADSERESDVDRALLSAGIGPGHPSLYATVPTQQPTP